MAVQQVDDDAQLLAVAAFRTGSDVAAAQTMSDLGQRRLSIRELKTRMAGHRTRPVVVVCPFGYASTIVPLHRRGLPWKDAAKLALAADTVSIAIMELVDNSVMWFVPGAMDAAVASAFFWGAMAFSLLVALFAAWPVNRWLLARGKGHALVHAQHLHPVPGADEPVRRRPIPAPLRAVPPQQVTRSVCAKPFV